MVTDTHDDHTPTAAQLELCKIAYKAGIAVDRAIRNGLDAMTTWLVSQYGKKPPTYEQFWSDRDALKAGAKQRGLVDDQTMRKPYNAAVKALYGELPVSQSLEAVSMRLRRPVVDKKAKAEKVKQARVERKLARATTTVAVMPKDAETAVRQVMEHFGFAQILVAFSKILAEHRETVADAKHLASLVPKFTVKTDTHAARSMVQ